MYKNRGGQTGGAVEKTAGVRQAGRSKTRGDAHADDAHFDDTHVDDARFDGLTGNARFDDRRFSEMGHVISIRKNRFDE